MKTEETQNAGRRGKQPMKTVLLCLSVDDLAPGNSACNKSTPRHMKELLCQMSTWEYLKVAHYIFKQLVSVVNEIIFDFLTDWFVKKIYKFFKNIISFISGLVETTWCWHSMHSMFAFDIHMWIEVFVWILQLRRSVVWLLSAIFGFLIELVICESFALHTYPSVCVCVCE